MFGQPMKCESLPMDHHHERSDHWGQQLEHERQHDDKSFHFSSFPDFYLNGCVYVTAQQTTLC